MPPPGSGTSNSFVVNGYSLLDGPKAQSAQNGGNESGGTVTVSGGSVPFEDDDYIVINAIDVDANGSIDTGSSIESIVVYDSYDDYVNGIALYTYEGSNGQTAGINNSTADLGDTYLGFNATVLTSDDPGAPDLGQVFVAAGVDLNDVAGGSTDLTLDTIDPNTNQDGNFGGDNNVICVGRGTLIDLPGGPLPVELLRVGDLVTTLDDGPQQIRWIGSMSVDARTLNAPILIKAGALGNLRDLYVSPNHRMLIRGPQAELLFGETEVLVAAKHLIDGVMIRQAPRARIDYFHFLFDRHQIIFAESCPTESLYPGELAVEIVDSAFPEGISLYAEPRGADPATEPQLSRYELDRREAVVLRMCG